MRRWVDADRSPSEQPAQATSPALPPSPSPPIARTARRQARKKEREAEAELFLRACAGADPLRDAAGPPPPDGGGGGGGGGALARHEWGGSTGILQVLDHNKSASNTHNKSVTEEKSEI